MSWLGNFTRQLSRSLDPRHDFEPQACFASFCKHWQQAYDIIQKSQPSHLHDDVLGVVNHLEQLATLLVLEARAREIHSYTSPAECLEYLLSENLLDKLYEWAICTGKYENAVRLEQLKLFASLVSHYSSQVIAAEPFLRPLLKLLIGFRNELPPPNVESQLVALLNQLCVALMQNIKFIDLFFLTTHTQNGSQSEFILVRLLVSSVHREGATGAASRDALLLCAKMSALSPPLAHCMASGNTCVVLATGLSGLYSLLPRTLNESVHRLTPDDVNHVHKLTLFIDSLEFCNAVAQVAHPTIKKQLLDLLYQGFLVPVMGPALLQSGASEQAAATAYFELVVRCTTTDGLLTTVLRFLLTHEYDGVKVADVILARLRGDSQLALVSLALMETLIDLNCEDVMYELVFKYLLNGHHLVMHNRQQIAEAEPYREAVISFLSLSPKCCSRPLEKTKEWVEEMARHGPRLLDLKKDDDGKSFNGMQGDIAMNNLVQEFKFYYGNPNETLLGNYHAYLCDARFEIVTRSVACSNWTSKYVTINPPKKETNNNRKETKEINTHKQGNNSQTKETHNYEKEHDSQTKETHNYEKEHDSQTKETHNHEKVQDSQNRNTHNHAKEQDSPTNTHNHAKEQDSQSNHAKEQDSQNKDTDNHAKEQDSQTKAKEQDSQTKETHNHAKEQDSQNKDTDNHTKEQDSIISICTSGYETLKTSDTSEKEPLSLTSLNENEEKIETNDIQQGNKEHDSLTSIGESSGYDSFKYKTEEMEDHDGYAEDLLRRSLVKTEQVKEYESEMPIVRTWRASAETVIGPLLSSLLHKAASLLEAELAVNWRVTSLISKLMSLPTPLLTSLLCPGFKLQPNMPSLYQILSKLRQDVDELTGSLDNTSEFIDKARVFLIQRELALATSRRPVGERGAVSMPVKPEETSYRRVEPKRRSISSSLSNMFGRRLSSSSTPPQSLTIHPHTYNTPSPQKRLVFTQEAFWNQSVTLRSILNAVILDEWLKELAAICEVQSLRITSEKYEQNSDIKNIAL